MALKVNIVGAGIAGLSTAIALCKAGHEVQVFEKSKFATEIGAAIVITPNGARVLKNLGFSFIKARGFKLETWKTLLGEDLQCVNSIDYHEIEKLFGAGLWAVHRVDFHNELLRLATADGAGNVRPLKLSLGAPIKNVSLDGCITLEDGTQHHGDLVIAADGLHSVVRPIVLGTDAQEPYPSGLSAFRFLLDTSLFEKDEQLAALLELKGQGAVTIPDEKEAAVDRRMVWYPCRNGTIQNFVGLDPIRKEDIAGSGPEGDAAHPMLPFSGQGANQALEDAGALGALFSSDLKFPFSPETLEERLCLFEHVRRLRASRVQIFSRARIGRESEWKEEATKYKEKEGDGGEFGPGDGRSVMKHTYG
ncbi:MAG: hypothetical protein Q9227_004532 [Pyrenula ochraceoflavens]